MLCLRSAVFLLLPIISFNSPLSNLPRVKCISHKSNLALSMLKWGSWGWYLGNSYIFVNQIQHKLMHAHLLHSRCEKKLTGFLVSIMVDWCLWRRRDEILAAKNSQRVLAREISLNKREIGRKLTCSPESCSLEVNCSNIHFCLQVEWLGIARAHLNSQA